MNFRAVIRGYFAAGTEGIFRQRRRNDDDKRSRIGRRAILGERTEGYFRDVHVPIAVVERHSHIVDFSHVFASPLPKTDDRFRVGGRSLDGKRWVFAISRAHLRHSSEPFCVLDFEFAVRVTRRFEVPSRLAGRHDVVDEILAVFAGRRQRR